MTREDHAERIANLMKEVMRGFWGHKPPHPPHPDITLAQFHCLRTIGDLGTPTMTDLASRLGLQPSTVTAQVDGLVAHGLVERREDPEDRRVVRVAVAPRSKQRHEAHVRAHRKQIMDLLTTLNDDQLLQVESALEQLRGAVLATREPQERSESRKGDG